MVSRLVFEEQAPVVASAPNRADIACFVGFVGRRNTAVPEAIRRWLGEQGWTAQATEGQPAEAVGRSALPASLDLAGASPWLHLTIDGLAQAIALPADPIARSDLVALLNRRVRGGYARLTDSQDAGPINRLVIGSDRRGNSASVAVRTIPALGFAAEVAAHGSDMSDGRVALLDLPVPIDTWDIFDRLFAWDRRPLDDRGQVGATYLGAAVRSFFAQGGRKCYVVRVGDPWSPTARRAQRLAQIEKLIPGFPNALTGSPVDRASWSGVAHLFGLPDVSFVCLPDLADAVGADRSALGEAEAPSPPEEQFVECSEPGPAPSPDRPARLWPAPRCDEAGYQDWARAERLAADLIARRQREVQLVAAVPIPQTGTAAERDLLAFLTDRGRGSLAGRSGRQLNGLASAFVQLVYPWVRTPGSANLPEQLESPDAVLVGLLARNALTRGAYRSAANLQPADVYDVYPALRRDQMLTPEPDGSAERAVGRSLLERVSLFGPTPSGLTLLSDVTTSLDERYRPASVNRLVSVIVRAARRLGEDAVFESSGERLWARLREGLNSLLLGLLQDGALRGATPAAAFHVRCDRTTMSQNDLDNGRIVAQVQFDATAPIERITVVLALDEGGQVSLLPAGSTNGDTQEAA